MVQKVAQKMTFEERMKMLSSEIALRAIYDLRLLQRRKVLNGDQLSPKETRPEMTDCSCYREDENIKNLIDDFKDGTVLFWCRMGGAEIEQSTLNRMLRKEAV